MPTSKAKYWVHRLYTPDTAVIATGAALLRIAALFELFDGVQVVATGANAEFLAGIPQ